MTQLVRAYGQILRFPKEMSDEAISKAILDNEHDLNPDYSPPASSKVKDLAKEYLGVDVDQVSKKISDSRKSVADRAEELAARGEDTTAPQVPGAPVRQSTYNSALLNDRFGIKSQESLDQNGILGRIRKTADEDIRGQGFQENLRGAITDAPPPVPSGFTGLAKNVLTGAAQTGRMIGASVDVARNDLLGVEDYAKESGIAAELNTPIEQRKLSEQFKQIDRDQGVAGMIGDTVSAARQNPMGMGQLVAEQLPNTGAILGGSYAGFKTGALAGAVFGPVGATIGGALGLVGGMFLGNALVESGGKAIEKASDEDGFTPLDREETINEGLKKSAVIAGVDLATLKIGGMLARSIGSPAINAGARAETKVLIDAGVDATSLAAINTALKSSPELFKKARMAGESAAIQSLSTGRKAAILGSVATLETIGEGVGEYGGEQWATGKGDVVDATIEALSSATMSLAETAYNYHKVASGNDLSAKGIQKAASSINDHEIKSGIDAIRKSQSVDDAIKAANEATSRKTVTKDDVLRTIDPSLKDIISLTGAQPIDSNSLGDSSNIKDSVNSAVRDAGAIRDFPVSEISQSQGNDIGIINTHSLGANPNVSELPNNSSIANSKVSGNLADSSAGIPHISHDLDVDVPNPTGSFDKKGMRLQESMNGPSVHIERLGDLTNSKAFVEQGFDGLNSQDRRVMVDSMVMTAHNDKILNSVIRSLPVNVVDVLRRKQLTPEMLLHDPSMLLNANSIVNGDNPVSVRTDVTGSFAKTLATVAAKQIPGFGGLDIGRSFVDSNPALSTIDNRHGITPNSSVVAGVSDVEASDVPTIISKEVTDKQAAKAKASDVGSSKEGWVIRNKATGEAIFETHDKKKVDALNTDKYEAVPTRIHLYELNDPNSKARQPAERPEQFKKDQIDEGLKFSRSPEERIKDRERAKQLESKLREQGYNFTIKAKDVRDFAAMDRGRQDEAIAAEQIAKNFGKRIAWIEATGEFEINGVIIPSIKDTIFIDVTTPKYAYAVLGHELSHHMERDAPNVYQDLVKSLDGLIKNHDEYANKYGIEGESKSYITKEIIGDLMGDNFTDQKFWNRVAEYNPSAFRKIADTIISWLKNLVVKAKSRGLGSERWVTDAQEAQDIIARSVAQYTNVDVTPSGNKSASIAAKSSRAGSQKITLGSFGDFKTGSPVTFNYLHNKESATSLFGKPTKESKFGRQYEPSGKYVINVTDDTLAKQDPRRYEYGELHFDNPLVLSNNNLSWKEDLSVAYGGKTGKQLSKALIEDGYDGVVTVDKYGTSEILDLTSFDESKAKFSKAEQDYRMEHKSPGREGNAPLSDLTGDGLIYPDDVYSNKAVQYYGTGDDKMDRQSFEKAKIFRGKPDAIVEIYRAVPEGVGGEINSGDWVTINKNYAKEHGESYFDGNYDILSKKVRAGDIFTNGDSIHEWGYEPDGNLSPELPLPMFGENNRLTNMNKDGATWSTIVRENPALELSKNKVTVFRATVGDSIRINDFVALNKSIAEQHLDNLKDRGEGGKIIAKLVLLDDLLMANDATEFVYYPKNNIKFSKARKGSIEDVMQSWEGSGVTGSASEKNGIITLNKIIVPKDKRNAGIGTAAMRELINYADATDQQIALTPSADFGGNKSKLQFFYRKLGFKKNKEFGVMESLIRDPGQVNKESNKQDLTIEQQSFNFGKLNLDYGDIEQRPGTTGKQRSEGRNAYQALLERIANRAGARVLGLAIAKDFKEQGGSSLIGQQVKASDDLATVAQVLRDPRYETFRVFYVKDNKIIHHTGITSRLPGMVNVASKMKGESESDAVDRFIDSIAKQKETSGADGYYLLHNHPSGRATPSQGDKNVTIKIANEVPGFISHVVINSNEYSVIHDNGDSEVFLKELSGGYGSDALIPHNVLQGRVLNSPSVMAEIGKTLQRKDGFFTLLGLSAQNQIISISEVPLSALNQSKTKLLAMVRVFARNSGSISMAVVTDPESSIKFKDAVKAGVLLDVVDTDGNSLREIVTTTSDRLFSRDYDKPGMRAEQQDANIPETINIDGVDRPTRNSDGKFIHPTEEGIKSFWQWFGDSKVVDDQGRPKVVYHGTMKPFNKIDVKKGAQGIFWFSSDKESIESGISGAASTRTIMPLYVKIVSPAGWEQYDNLLLDEFKSRGLDGAILPREEDNFDGFILNKLQVKSAEKNTGSFSSESDDIRFSKAEKDTDIPWSDTSIFEPKYIFSDGSKANKSDYNKYINRPFSFEDIFKRETDGDKVIEVIPADSIPKPKRSKFLTQENVDNISRAILAVKKGILETGKFSNIVADNLPLPPESERGSNMIGDVYGGSLVDNLIYHFGGFLENLGIPYIDTTTGKQAHYRKADWSKLTIEKDEISTDARGKYYVATSPYSRIGPYKTEDEARKEYSSSYDGRGMTIGDGASGSFYIIGGGQLSREPYLYDRIIAEFRKNPVKLLYSVMSDIDGRLKEQEADMLFFNAAIENAREVDYNKSPEGRRGKFKIIDGITKNGNDDIKFSKSEKQEDPLMPESKFRKFQRFWQDDFNRFVAMKEWLSDRGINLSEQADVSRAEERYHSKVANQIEDFNDFVASPLIEKIAKAGFTMSDVADYLEAQHAEEANDVIAKLHKDQSMTAYGITNDEAEDYLSKAPKELGVLANEFRDITEKTKKLLLDEGLRSQEEVDAWEAAYKHYIPVKGGDQPAKGTGKGLSVNSKTKRRLGHGRRDEAVIENILLDYNRAVIEVEKNRIAKHLGMMAAEIAMPELMTIGQPVKRNVLKNAVAYEVQVKGVIRAVFDSREGANVFKQMLPATDKKIAPSEITINPTRDQRIISSAAPMLAENEINMYIDGHAIRIQINDEIAARAYKHLGIEGYGHLVAAGRAINGYLSKAYTGYAPEWGISNIIRDFTAGIINLTGEEGIVMAVKAVKNYPGSFASLLRYAFTGRKQSNKWIDMYRANGGNTGAAWLPDMERLSNDVASEYAAFQGVISNLKQGDMANASRAALRKLHNVFLKWLNNLNQASENAMRLSAFRAMIESGKSVNEASHIAKNITINFNKKGEFGQTANAAYLFFNATMNGQAAMNHALFKGKHKYQAWALGGAGLTALGYTMAAMLGGGDEDEYDKLDDYTKERNMVIKSGDGWIKIPVPYGHGFFWSLGRSIADAQRKDELGALPWHIASSAIEELTPFGSIVVGSDEEFKSDQVLLGLLPTVAQIAVQPALNKSIFSGGEVMPESPFDKSQPDREKMWRGTKGTMYDKTSGWLKDAGIDVSPETLKHLTRSATGGAGATADAVISAAMLKTQGAEMDANEVPFVRKLYHEPTIRSDRAAFNKAREEAKTAAEEFRRAKRDNDLVSINKILKDKKEMIMLDNYANKLQKYINFERDQQDAVKVDESIPVAERRLKLKLMESRESKFYDKYLDIFKTNKTVMKERLK